MPPLPAPTLVNVQFHFSTFENSNVISTHHYATEVPVNTGTEQATDVCGLIDAHFRPLFIAVLSQDWAFDGTVIQMITNGQTFEAAVGGSEDGSVNSDALPSYAAAVLQLWSDGVGRGARGRRYIPGVPESSTESSRLIRTAPWTTLSNAYLWDFSFAGEAFGSAHLYKYDMVENFAAVVDSQFSINLGTMRSRKRRYPV